MIAHRAPAAQSSLHQLACNIPVMAFQMVLARDAACSFTFVNDSVQHLLGVSSTELMHAPLRFRELLLPQDRQSFDQSLSSAAELNTIWNWDGRIRLSEGGAIKWINVRAAPTRDMHGATVWNGIVTNVTGSKVSSVELNRANKRLQALAVKLESVRDEERAAIARELHDDLGAVLTALKLSVAMLKRTATGVESLPARLAELDELIERGADTMRRIASRMRHAMLDYGVREAFEWVTKDFAKRSGVPCGFRTNIRDQSLRAELSTVLFRLLQEALTNITKHAQASEVQVRLWLKDGDVELSVRDNGKGVSLKKVNNPGSSGLRNAREYAEIMRGHFSLNAAPGGGTQLVMRLPLLAIHQVADSSRFVGAGKRLAVLPHDMTQPPRASRATPSAKARRTSKKA